MAARTSPSKARGFEHGLAHHLEIIQGIITRMAGNSFFLKGWSVTLAAALIALGVKEGDPLFAAVAILPALAFWALDAHYLRLERQYRGLYDYVRREWASRGELADPYSLAIPAEVSVPSWFRTLFSQTVWAIHLPLVISIAAVVMLLWLKVLH